MALNDRAEIRKMYERYKLQWMLYHDFGFMDFLDCMEAMIHEDLSSKETRTKLQDLFKEWELGIGFPGGQIWPCFEEYRDGEYETDSDKACILISVFERDISTEIYPNPEMARITMLEELETEFLKGHNKSEWDTVVSQRSYECDTFGFDEQSAWSNLDDDRNCDWLIISIPRVIAK